MKHTRSAALFIISLMFLAGGITAFAQWDPSLYSLSPPPAKGSAEEMQDYRIIHEYQNQRTSAQCAAADAQSYPSAEVLFGPRSRVLTAAEFKSVETKIERITSKVIDVASHFKEKYDRPRPYNVDRTIHPCVAKPGGNAAYPSGHATLGIVLSLVLAKEFPAKKETILEHGLQIGTNRLIGGVHHPSDVEAGQNLGRQIGKKLNAVE